MTALTVWGRASTIGGVSEERSVTGRITGGHSFDDVERKLPIGGVPVNFDHTSQRRGEVAFVEISDSGAVNVVVVLDSDELSHVEEDIYFSPEWLLRGVGVEESFRVARTAELRSVALTTDPGNHGPRPVRWRTGSILRAADRANWPVSFRSVDPLLGRAASFLEQHPVGGCRQIVDRRDDQMLAWMTHQQRHTPDLNSYGRGEMMIRPGGRIISVR